VDPTSPFLQPAFLIPVVGVAVVLLGIVIAVVTIMRGRAKKGALDRWARGAYAIWTGGEDCASWTPQRAQQSLQSWYGATASQPFWGVITELKQGQTGNPAWDLVRALDLLRIGLAAQYIDLDQARKETAAIGSQLQRLHRGWEELAQAFEAGMLAWHQRRGVTDPEQTGRVQKNLPKLRQEIWPGVPWATPLVFDDD
jgi:hypothetical protein